MPRVAHGSSATPEQLRQAHAALASRAMVDPGAATGDGVVPAIYTYFASSSTTTSPSRPARSPPASCWSRTWPRSPWPGSVTTSRTCARPAWSWTACTARRPPATRPTTTGC